MKDVLVLLDNGHGVDTGGKRSPVWQNGTQLFEYEFNRDVVQRIAELLQKEGVRVRVLVPEIKDIKLPERCRRANAIYQQEGGKVIMLSIHANAGGGTGWEWYTSPGKTESDNIATVICNQFEKDFPERKMRFDYSDGDPDKEAKFYILMHFVGPVVLTESFFMDTPEDCELILSDKGRQRVAESHARAIVKYLNS